jgi:hypothetical protein
MSAKSTAAEVGVKLVLDSNAKAEAEHIRGGLRSIEMGADHAASGWKDKIGGGMSMIGGLAVGAAAMAATAAAAVGSAMVGLGVKSAEAFMESAAQVRGLASTLTLIDQKGNSFEKLSSYAWDVKDGLQEVAIQAGYTDEAMVAVFTDIVERGGKSVDQAQKLTEQMAYAGRALPGGPEALSAGFEMLQMGMIKAKNPLIQLIAATGTMKGSAKSVANEMKKMTIDKQMALAEKAIGKMSEKMQKAPMETAIGKVFETAGEPIVAAISPVVGKVRDLLMDNSGGFLEGAKKFGEFISRPVGLVVPIIEGLVKAVGDSWGDIMKTFDAVYGPFDGMVHYLYDNKEAFAQTIADAAKGLITAATLMIRAATAVRDAIMGAVSYVLKSGVLGSDTQNFMVDSQHDTQRADLKSHLTAGGPGSSMDQGDYDMRRAQYVEAAQGTARLEGAGAEFDASYRRIMDDHNATLAAVGSARDAAMTGDAAQFAQAFNVAMKANDEGAEKYVASFLKENESLSLALGKLGPEVFGEGMSKLKDVVQAMGDKDSVAALQKGMKPNMGIAAKGNIIQNFNGAISIKQDFRDQDPDRVAVVFKNELGKYASNRVASGFAQPFGF